MGRGVTTSKTSPIISPKPKEEPKKVVVKVETKLDSELKMSKEIEKSGKFGMYLGYRIVEDNGVRELRLPKDVIQFLMDYADWTKMDEKFKNAEIVPDKFYVCFKCGFKRPKIKGTHANMFLCNKCNKPLHG